MHWNTPFSVSNKFEVSGSFWVIHPLLLPSYVYIHIHTLINLLSPANKEYYHQWSVEECHGCSLDLSAFTIEELDNITSEYTLKNTVSFNIYTIVALDIVFSSPKVFPAVSVLVKPSEKDLLLHLVFISPKTRRHRQMYPEKGSATLGNPE